MAIGLRRKVRLDSRRDNQKITRARNNRSKSAERARRRNRVAQAVAANKGGEPAPWVKSWISSELGKPYSTASDADIKALFG